MAVGRAGRRHRLQAAARPDLGRDRAILDLLDRPVPRRADARRPREAVPALDLVDEAMSEVVLRTHALVKRFGGITATNNVSLAVTKGARHALIGPNGAGKTTLINQLTGVMAPTSGRVELQGRDITDLEPHKRVGLGLVRTFQINQLFGTLTPLQSLALAVASRVGA